MGYRTRRTVHPTLHHQKEMDIYTLSQLITSPLRFPTSCLDELRQDYSFSRPAPHLFSSTHKTKAAIAPRTNGTPVTAALTAPPALKVIFTDVCGVTVLDDDPVVCGSVVGTLSVTVGVTDSVTGVLKTEGWIGDFWCLTMCVALAPLW